MPRFSIPTAARLPPSLRVDSSNPTVLKSLNRLSRESLISLALDWLDERTVPNAVPYLGRRDDEVDDEADDLYPPCRSIDEIQQLYLDMQEQKGSRRDVVSRILDGDWRHGLSLYQLAMADMSYLDEHPTSQRWTAYQIMKLERPSKEADDGEALKVNKKSLEIPRFHPSTFLQNLQDQVLPDVKAHYHFHRPKDFPLLLLRIFVIDSPYNSDLALSGLDSSGTAANFDSSRTIYLAFPDGSPSLYITKSQSTGPISLGESKSLRSLIVDGVPKALSRPRDRYTVKVSSLTSRNLNALLDKRGPGRGNSAGGGWSIYADEKNKKSPLDPLLPTPPLSRESSQAGPSRKRDAPMMEHQRATKRAKAAAKARFGNSGIVSDGKGVERLDIVVEDPFPPSRDDADVEHRDEEPDTGRVDRRRSKVDITRQQIMDVENVDVEEEGNQSRWTPSVRITFQGSHVFAGIRQLVEAGIVDGRRMPGWMTGDEGVTMGLIRHGRIRGHKGSGI